MKRIIILAIATLSSLVSFSQDSSQYYISFNLKQEITALLVPDAPTIKDKDLMDTIKKAIGSGTQRDSISIVRIRVGTMYNLAKNVLNLPAGSGYEVAYKWITATKETGGLMTWLYFIGTGNTADKAGAYWLYFKMQGLIALYQQNLIEEMKRGADKARTPIIQN